VALAACVFAPHYALPLVHGCVSIATPIRAEPSDTASAVSELLRGEDFAVVDVAGGWAWGYGLHDHYVGYIAAEALGAPIEASHVVTAPRAPVFAAADIKAPVVAIWPIGARFAGTQQGDFVETPAGYVHHRHAGSLPIPERDPVAVAERLVGTPYVWGGRGGGGVDCSGLVQLALGLAGIAAPRDSDQQQALGAPIATGEALRRGDLIFFPGHVGIMVDPENMVHANAHWMAVAIEPLADIVARLAGTQAEPVIARRRI